jgi:hypothetical protein
VSFITTESGEDLIVAYAISMAEHGEIASLILQRTPKFEMLLPPEERGVAISHELFPAEDDAPAFVRRIIIDGPMVDIEASDRTYLLDLAGVEPDELRDSRRFLERMHRFGGFELTVRDSSGP